MSDREYLVKWDATPLKRVVASTDFMPGWQIYLSQDNEGSGAPVLHILSYTPDSYSEHPNQMIRVNHSFLVPMASYNERTWKAWVRDCYSRVWNHEIGEFLKFDGIREFAPHHGNGEDPYLVWHVGDLEDTDVPAGSYKSGDQPPE